jgi:hypothetical protein
MMGSGKCEKVPKRYAMVTVGNGGTTPPFLFSELVGGELSHSHPVRFEVFTAVTTKNAVFWDIRTQFVPHTRHITSPLQSSAS